MGSAPWLGLRLGDAGEGRSGTALPLTGGADRCLGQRTGAGSLGAVSTPGASAACGRNVIANSPAPARAMPAAP